MSNKELIIPKSFEDVVTWLKEFSISEEIISNFKQNQIDGESLLDLTIEELKNEYPNYFYLFKHF